MEESINNRKVYALIFKVIFVLAIIQGIRASLVQLSLLLGKSVETTGFIFIIMGAALYLIFKPDKQSLGLSISEKSRKVKAIYIFCMIVFLTMILTSPVLSKEINYNSSWH